MSKNVFKESSVVRPNRPFSRLAQLGARVRSAVPLALAVVAVQALGATSVQAVPLSALAQNIMNGGAMWAQALLVLGGLFLGGKAVMGSHETGKHATQYFIGAVFLVLAGMGGPAAFNFAKSLVGNLN